MDSRQSQIWNLLMEEMRMNSQNGTFVAKKDQNLREVLGKIVKNPIPGIVPLGAAESIIVEWFIEIAGKLGLDTFSSRVHLRDITIGQVVLLVEIIAQSSALLWSDSVLICKFDSVEDWAQGDSSNAVIAQTVTTCDALYTARELLYESHRLHFYNAFSGTRFLSYRCAHLFLGGVIVNGQFLNENGEHINPVS